MVQARFQRYELKYFVYPDEMDAVRARVAPFMHVDRYARGRSGSFYTVRSIYFDTWSLRFYNEKEAGVKVRKKLRVRTYNQLGPDSVAFFEIKRKYGNSILKERVGMPFDRALALLEEDPVERADPDNLADLSLSIAARTSLERFFFLQEALQLQPVVLVVYEREAYVGRENERIRVTLDCDVRSIIDPRFDEFFIERGLRRFTNRRQILEVKFDGAMPPWMRPVMAMLDRSHRPISKYCNGIDLWHPADDQVSDLGALVNN